MQNNNTFKDMTDQQFGYLHVLRRAENRKSPSGNIVTRWHCRCVCGKEIDVDAYALRSGNTKSCGCSMKHRSVVDITGKRFTKLTVIKLDRIENRKSYWLCQCDCGNQIIVPKCNLENNNTKSCGCIYSLGETEVAKELNKRNIQYVRGKRFDDLLSDKGYNLIFDFAILNNNGTMFCLLEYQGIQHYENFGIFGQMQRDVTDKAKKDWCESNNILLYEIRFDENISDKIDELELLLKENTVPSSK